jgi:hypothetical protein
MIPPHLPPSLEIETTPSDGGTIENAFRVVTASVDLRPVKTPASTRERILGAYSGGLSWLYAAVFKVAGVDLLNIR